MTRDDRTSKADQRGALRDDPVEWTVTGAIASLTRIGDLLRFATSRFLEAGLDFRSGMGSADLDAAFLIAELLHLEPAALADQLDARVVPGEARRILEVVRERCEGRRPLAYLLGATWYCGHRLRVDERALIPRSAVGTMLEDVFLAYDPEGPWRILDIGTGNGGIAVAYASHFPNATVVATELCPDALALARENMELHGLTDRVELRQGDLYDCLEEGERFDWILCNPPYVSEDFRQVRAPESGFEPDVALFGGEDGLKLILRLLDGAPAHLHDDGRLVFETGEITGERLREERPELRGEWWLHPESETPVAVMLRKDELG